MFRPPLPDTTPIRQPRAGRSDVNPSGGVYRPGANELLLNLVTGADASGAGGTVTGAPGGLSSLGSVTQVALTDGAGYVVYEVEDANPNADGNGSDSGLRFQSGERLHESLGETGGGLRPDFHRRHPHPDRSDPSVCERKRRAPIVRYSTTAMQSLSADRGGPDFACPDRQFAWAIARARLSISVTEGRDNNLQSQRFLPERIRLAWHLPHVRCEFDGHRRYCGPDQSGPGDVSGDDRNCWRRRRSGRHSGDIQRGQRWGDDQGDCQRGFLPGGRRNHS